ncbi:MAG: sigma-54-dependent transcriptional regulator [Candidatus Sumerlaeia bacterium]
MQDTMPNTYRILVVDDDDGILFVLDDLLKKLGYDVTCVSDGQQALDAMAEQTFDVALLDIELPHVDGMDVLRHARQHFPDTIILIISGHGGPDVALEAIREGAYDYFSKPFEIQEIRITIQRALEKKMLVEQIRELETQLGSRHHFPEIIGNSAAMQSIYDMMGKVVDNDVPVLVTGESGTGKELVSEAIHARSPRKDSPMVKINCAAIPEALLESELFGHEKGSFTGAIQSRAGKFEQAQDGTLFLDEIGEMPLPLQAKILRAVQQKEVQRVGGKAPVHVNVRLVTATNKNLAEEVAAKRFREDLYYRINVITIELPPLRERLTDIPLLVNFFINLHKDRLGKGIEGVDQKVMDRFLQYPWPGNVREMENVIQRAMVMAGGTIIQLEDLPPVFHQEDAPMPTPSQNPREEVRVDLDRPMKEIVDQAVAKVERMWISEALKQCKSRRDAAKLLKISPRSLDYKIQRYELSS